MWKKLNELFGTGGNDLLSGEYTDTSNTNGSYTTTTTTGTTFYPVGTTITVPSTPQSTWTVQFPYIASSGTAVNFNNINISIKPEHKIILSSEKAYFLSEDEIIGLLNPCKAMVEVYQSHSQMIYNGDDGVKTYITLEEFLEQFRPELFQKYKLLIEKT